MTEYMRSGRFGARFHMMVQGKLGHRRSGSRGGIVASPAQLGIANPRVSGSEVNYVQGQGERQWLFGRS